ALVYNDDVFESTIPFRILLRNHRKNDSIAIHHPIGTILFGSNRIRVADAHYDDDDDDDAGGDGCEVDGDDDDDDDDYDGGDYGGDDV
ncbi:hypothetical protein QR98_0053840, partial [Sarcoptes scabiei]